MKKFLITVNGKQYEVDCEEIKGGVSAAPAPVAVSAAPVSAPVTTPVVDAHAAPVAPAAPVASGSAGSVKISAPMPGTIVKVEVSVGDAVKSGQTLVVLEAMKMENEIKAPGDGVVASINTSKGTNVDSGALLVTLN